MPIYSDDIIARFWAKVDVRGPDECWPWTAYKTRDGYGQIGTGLNAGPDRAHRVSYEIANCELLGERIARHTCDNPSCVNPRHLLAGSHADNSRDAMERGRLRTKLTPERVRIIRERLALGHLHADIAADEGVCRPNVTRIASGTYWPHVQ